MAGTRLPVEAAGQDDLINPEHGVLTFIDNNVDSTTGTIKLKGTFRERQPQIVARRIRQRDAEDCPRRPTRW